MRIVAPIMAAFAALALAIPTPAPAAEIVWRVENSFRLFADPGDTDTHRLAYESLSPGERLEPVRSAERRLASLDPQGWARDVYRNTCWRTEVSENGTCGPVADYVNPKRHRVILEARGIDRPWTACTWRIVPAGEAREVGTTEQSGRCDEKAVVEIPFPGGADVSLAVDGESIAFATVKVRDLFIVGLGDSFGSGEGNPDQPVELSRERDASYGTSPAGIALTGYPTRIGAWDTVGDRGFLDSGPRWWSQACHRSLYSHQVRAALQLSLEDPHRAVTFVSFACAGAEATFGLLIHYRGTEWAPDQPDKPQVSSAAQAQCGGEPVVEENYPTAFSVNGQIPELDNIFIARCPREKARRIDLLMLSVGGNDIGFASLVANAVLDDTSVLRKIGGWMGKIYDRERGEEQLPELALRYKAINRALHGNLSIPWSQSDRVLLTAYPVMSLLEDGSSVCPDGSAGMGVYPEFRLSEQKAREGEAAAEALDRTMRTAAGSFGWSYVDGHRQAFAGHGLCSGTQGVAGEASDDTHFPRRVNGAWAPYNPADYQPYAPRRRWFRTPDDAFLTGNFHVGGALLKSALGFESTSWFQLVLASTYSGAFHPNAEGQAVIADAVTRRAREILAKYERRRR